MKRWILALLTFTLLAVDRPALTATASASDPALLTALKAKGEKSPESKGEIISLE